MPTAARGTPIGRPDDGACIHLYTSGTTGNPKGCLLSQRGWLAANANLAHALAVQPDDRLLAVFPFFHVAGFGVALSHFTMGAPHRHPGRHRHRGDLAAWSTTRR